MTVSALRFAFGLHTFQSDDDGHRLWGGASAFLAPELTIQCYVDAIRSAAGMWRFPRYAW
jgi:hypothetical protein